MRCFPRKVFWQPYCPGQARLPKTAPLPWEWPMYPSILTGKGAVRSAETWQCSRFPCALPRKTRKKVWPHSWKNANLLSKPSNIKVAEMHRRAFLQRPSIFKSNLQTINSCLKIKHFKKIHPSEVVGTLGENEIKPENTPTNKVSERG